MHKCVKLIKPGKTYKGSLGVTYSARVYINTASSKKICMNILPMQSRVHSIPNIHKEI